MHSCVSQGRFMPDKPLRNNVRILLFATLLLPALRVAAQAPAAGSPARPQTAPPRFQSAVPGVSDPRQPEIQPNPALDRDPIPSPDAPVPETLPTASNAPASP